MLLTRSKSKVNISFGPPHAVLNLSKLGLRYFRIALNISARSQEQLVKNFISHPNVGWMFSAEGWFNFAVGIWARDNAEINDVSAAIRSALSPEDRVVFQSELTSLYGFGDRAIGKTSTPMPILDAVYQSVDLSPIDFDYIKLVALDSSMSPKELAQILNVSSEEVISIHQKLKDTGVIVGDQERIDYGNLYFKVFVDTSSKKKLDAAQSLTEKLWNDDRCIYFARANSTYDLEFEIILHKKSDIKEYLRDFSEYEVAILTKNLYTNLYPLSKISNLGHIREELDRQNGDVIDLGNSKLWYLNHEGTQGYLSIYEDRKYFEAMEQSELNLFDDIVTMIKDQYPDTVFSVIDLGSGDGMKSRIFIEKLWERSVKAYYPVDVQPIELATALKAHAEGSYAKHPTLLDFENLSARFPLKLGPSEKQIYLFLGGTYGNYPSNTINQYIKKVVSLSSLLFVSMPVRTQKSSQEILDQYTSKNIEITAFGPLAQMGFEKKDFEPNPNAPELYVQPIMENERVRTTFILKNDVTVLGRTFLKGTTFKLTSSWKPSPEEARQAFESDFIVERTFLNDEMSISLLKEKED